MRGAILALLVLFVISEPVFAQREAILDTVSIQLKWHHQFQFAGYYAADIKGFYKDEGLYVNIIEGSIESDYQKSVLNEGIEFSIYDSGLLKDFANNKPLVALNAIFQYSPKVIAARSNRNFNQLSDLADATIMSSSGIGTEMMKSIFIAQGINVDSMKVVPFNIDQFKTDTTIDAINTYITLEVPMLELEGIELDVFLPWRYGIDFYGDVLFTSRDFLEKNRPIVEAFQRATIKGWEYSRMHQEEIIDHILTYPSVRERGLNKELLTIEAQKTWEYTIPDKIPIGYMSMTRWSIIADFFQKFGIIKDVPDLERFLIQPIQPLSIRIANYLTIIIPALLIAASIIFIWILTLRREVKTKTDELKIVFEERVKAEQESKNELLSAFKEKEVILAEVHHRVKNNMALITSLIELQRQEIDPLDADTILKEAQLRIHTIADIHEKLYDNESFLKVPFQSYIDQQIDNVVKYIDDDSIDLTIVREIDAVSLNINYSIPVALIINECITNCLKHAFKGRDQGTITVHLSVQENNELLVVVQDDGVGFNTDPSLYNSVGLTIIRALADQIEADLDIKSSEKGTTVSVRFTTTV